MGQTSNRRLEAITQNRCRLVGVQSKEREDKDEDEDEACKQASKSNQREQ